MFIKDKELFLEAQTADLFSVVKQIYQLTETKNESVVSVPGGKCNDYERLFKDHS